MTVTHGRLTNIYLNGYDLTGVLNKASFPLKQDVFPTPVFGKTARPKILGTDDASVKMSGWLDNLHATGGVLDAAMQRAAGSQVIYLPDGDVLGGFGMACAGNASEYEEASEDAPNKIMAGFDSSVGAERVVVLKALAAMTATHTGVGQLVTGGAATTTEGAGYIHVGALTGFTSIAAKVQHSSDSTNGVDGVWVDLANFTAITAERTVERIVVADGTTVSKWRRIVVTPTGSGSVEVFAGFGTK